MAQPIILYTRPGCPFSAKVLLDAAVLGIDLEERSIKHAEYDEELILYGGKRQTPFLRDIERDRSLYDSDAIMTYLHERFGRSE